MNGRGATRTSASSWCDAATSTGSKFSADLPDELSQALLDAWRGMSEPPREGFRILAVGGRPADLGTLEGVVGAARSLVCRVDPRGHRRRGRRDRARRCLVPTPSAGGCAGGVLPARRGGPGARGVGGPLGVGLRRRSREERGCGRPRVSLRERLATPRLLSVRWSRVPTSPRSSTVNARPRTCWSGRSTCGSGRPTPATPSAMHKLWSGPASPADGWGGPEMSIGSSSRRVIWSPPSVTRCGRAG